MRHSFFALALLMLALVAACGSSPEGAATEASPTPTTETPTTSTPTTAPVEAVNSNQGEAITVRLEYGSEPDQFGRLQLPLGPVPDGGFPVVVLIHGGFWRELYFVDLMNNVADDLADRGYASWNIEYRRVDGAGGWPETGDDVADAIAHLADIAATQPVDLDCVVSVGHSAGGHLALWALGQEGRVEVRGAVGLGAVVDLASFTQSVGLLGGTIDEVPEVYADAAPVLDPGRAVLIHAGMDQVIPAESFLVAESAGVPVITIPDDRHFDLIRPPSDSWTAALEAIDRLLTPTCTQR